MANEWNIFPLNINLINLTFAPKQRWKEFQKTAGEILSSFLSIFKNSWLVDRVRDSLYCSKAAQRVFKRLSRAVSVLRLIFNFRMKYDRRCKLSFVQSKAKKYTFLYEINSQGISDFEEHRHRERP